MRQLLIVLMICWVLSINSTYGCSCASKRFYEHYCGSDIVVDCQFTSMRVSRGFRIFQCKIEHVYKGNLTGFTTIQVATPVQSSLCGVFFESGCNAPTYLITGRLKVVDEALNQKIVETNLCDYHDTEPSDEVRGFLQRPTCLCQDTQCEPWQDCKVHTKPDCLNTTTTTTTTAQGPYYYYTAEGQLDGISQISGDVANVVPVPCSRAYCQDDCARFPCPNGTICKLVGENCQSSVFCPQVARCFPTDPCAAVLCDDGYQCTVDENTGLPVCVPVCPDCPPGYHCEAVDVDCSSLSAACPSQRVCVPDDPPNPCTLQVDQGSYIDGDVDESAETERFYFDTTTKECLPFTYKGDGGNDNNFETVDECEEMCPNIPPCKQALVVGNCTAAITRYFYNVTSEECQVFSYSGCGGNDNNFESLQECQNTCPPPRPCSYPKDSGSLPCPSTSSTKWYFDEATAECKSLEYTGCGGNPNRFNSKVECQQTCPVDPCRLPRRVGFGDGAVVPRWFFNFATSTCDNFKYRGNGGNLNNFLTKGDCELKCPIQICRLPPRRGPCKKHLRRWYFNWQDQRCHRFIYGGCLGNRNNFETLQKCQQACPHRRVCTLNKDYGTCNGRFKRWYFDKSTKRCERFIYSGCGGNPNNFRSKSACLRRCTARCMIPKPCDTIRCRPYQQCNVYPPTGQPYCADTCTNYPCKAGFVCQLKPVDCIRAPCPPVATCVPTLPADPCELPKQVGNGKGFIQRWYFDANTGVCRQFAYSGRSGNSNNFASQSQCERVCRPPNTCSLSADVGDCDLNVQSYARYFHNKLTGKCEQFQWSGCGGNRNRFVTQQACEAVCPPEERCQLPKYSCKTASGNCVCTADIKYYHDVASGTCKQYPADECPLNDNTFSSLSECTAACNVNTCLLPPDHGPCNCLQVRYYFDAQTRQCRPFRYGSCGGNGNNFKTIDECRSTCGNNVNPCAQPLMYGRGPRTLPRFYFNDKVGGCRSFMFGSLDGGNDNNFVSMEACESTCNPIDICPGCSGPSGLVLTNVNTDIDPANVLYGYCCLPLNTSSIFPAGIVSCCCPATSDRDQSCRSPAVYRPQLPAVEIDKPVDFDIADLQNPEEVDDAEQFLVDETAVLV